MTASVTLMTALPDGLVGSMPSQRLGKSSSSHINRNETETTINEENAGQYARKLRLFRASTAAPEKRMGRPRKVTIWNRLLVLLKAKNGSSKRSRLQTKKISSGNMRPALLRLLLVFSTFTRFNLAPHCTGGLRETALSGVVNRLTALRTFGGDYGCDKDFNPNYTPDYFFSISTGR
jgi:hypothetical protein